MNIIIDDDLTAVILDDADNPTMMMRLPNYDLETRKRFASASQAQSQAERYAVRTELMQPYVSPEEEAANLLAEKSEAMRATRNQLLTSCDWTQVADAPIDKAAWATYRQELRDITTDAHFPNLEEADWPVAP